MPLNLYKKLIAALYIENFNFIAWFNKIEKDQKEFKDIQEAISFILTPLMLNNYDCSKLEDFLAKFIKFVNTFHDENIKIKLSNYFINSDLFLSKLIDKDTAFLAFDTSYKTILFLQKILSSPNLKKFFLETDKLETIAPDDSSNFLFESFSFFIQNGILSLKETSKQMAMGFVSIIQQSQEEDLIKAIKNLILKYFPPETQSFNEDQNFFLSCNFKMLLFSIMKLKESTYSNILKVIPLSFTPGCLERVTLSNQADWWGFSHYLKEILLISNFIKEKSISPNEKQKSFEFLSNKIYFKPFYYTEFKEIMQELIKKIEIEESNINFIGENINDYLGPEETIPAIKIEKLISYFSTESLKFYKLHFIEFLNHEMKITPLQINALIISINFNSDVICYTGKELLHYSHPFGKQIFIKDLNTLKTDLKIRSVGITEINLENLKRKNHHPLYDEITLTFQHSRLFCKSAEPSRSSEIIIEKNICHVFKIKDSSKILTNFEIILSGLLSSLPGTAKNDLIIKLMKTCLFYFEFHEHNAWELFCFLRKKLTRKLPEYLAFFENICLSIIQEAYYNPRCLKFKNLYAFLRKKDFPRVDRFHEFIFEKSNDSQEIIFLLELFILAYKFQPGEKNIDFISKIYDFFKLKDQNSALTFIHRILSSPEDYCGGFYIECGNLSKFINQIFSSLIYNENLDVSTLGSIFELANKKYSSKLTKDTLSTLEKRLRDSNIDEKNKKFLVDRIQK